MGRRTGQGKHPFLLSPSGKDYLWGGRRLNDEFAKGLAISPLAETWECSTHPEGPSYVRGGEYDGLPLQTLLQENPDFLGRHSNPAGELPILIKFIDADKDLSIQVHPDDNYAAAHEGGQRGKTEMWYVLDAARDARLIYGLKWDVKADTLRRSIEAGTVEQFLQRIPVQKDDVFFIEAGTIHAIGAGVLVAEIQENSNLTYRLFDYNRVDKNGNKRPLHVEKALEVASLKNSAEPRQPLRVLKYRQGVASELLCRCKYFEVYRMLVNTERRQMVYYRADSLSFRVLLCIGGCGVMMFSDQVLSICKGDCVFVPADSEEIRLHGVMQFLDIRG